MTDSTLSGPPLVAIGAPARTSVHPLLLTAMTCLFVLSGFSALTIEQVLEKWLLTVVGSATHSAALVVGTFFGGLSAGGLLYRKLRRAIPDALVLFVLLELTVALSGLLVAASFVPVQSFSAALVRLGGESALGAFASRCGVTIAWLALPTMAMGATYPAMLALLEGLGGTNPRLPTFFYAANLLGAVGAAALAPYVLFPRFGLAVTIEVVAVVQLTVSLGFFVAARRHLRARGSAVDLRLPLEAEERLRLNRPQHVLLLLAFASGFLFFTLEVVWYHLIGATIGMSAYAFATMLSLVLLALFAGSLVVSALPDRPDLGERLLPLVLLGCALALSRTLQTWDTAPDTLFERGYNLREFADGEWLRFRVAAERILPPAFAAGMIYPLLLRTRAFRSVSQPRLAALLGAANAIGSLLGAWLTSFVFLGLFGAERTLWGLVLLLLGIGTLLAVLGRRALPTPALPISMLASRARPAVVTVLVLACGVDMWLAKPWDRLALTSGYHVYFRPQHVHRDSKLIDFREDGGSGFVSVVETMYGDRPLRTLLTNGKFQGNDGGEVYAQIALALLPLLATPQRNQALVIGYGTGQSAKVVADAGFDHVDIVEISESIVRAAQAGFSHLTGDTLERPNIMLHIEDGRQHLLRTDKQYDVVSMEISSIWFAGATNLYSQNFYELVRARLAPGGVMQQWVQLHHLTSHEVLSVLRTVHVVFPETRLYFVGNQGIILASNKPLPAPETFEAAARNAPAELLADIAALELEPDAALKEPWTRLVLDSRDLAALSDRADIIINTDENHFLEFATPRHALSRSMLPDALVRELLELVPTDERARRRDALFGGRGAEEGRTQ